MDKTEKPIPTQLNIAPRGKSWKNWNLIDGTDGFPTRETMEKFLCNPARVRDLEDCRVLNLETIARLEAHVAHLEKQLADQAAKQSVQQDVKPYAVLVFERGEEGPFDRKPVKPDSVHHLHAKRDPHYDYIELYTHPTRQGLDAQRWQIVHNRISGEYIAGRAHFVVQLAPVPDTNIMRGSVAEHFTKAVDFAAAQAKQGGV